MMSLSAVTSLPGLPEGGRRHHQHGGVDQPGDPHRDQDVDQLVAEDAPLQRRGAGHDPVLRQRRVEVDDVRHHGGAEDAGRQQDTLSVPANRGRITAAAAAPKSGRPRIVSIR